LIAQERSFYCRRSPCSFSVSTSEPSLFPITYRGPSRRQRKEKGKGLQSATERANHQIFALFLVLRSRDVTTNSNSTFVLGPSTQKEFLKLDHFLPLPTKPCRSFSFALDFSLFPPSVSSLEYGPTADRFFEFQPSSSTSRYSPKPTGKTRIDALEHILVIWDHLRRALFIVDSTRTAHRKAFPASTASFVQRTP
jgi:hypothetical protein